MLAARNLQRQSIMRKRSKNKSSKFRGINPFHGDQTSMKIICALVWLFNLLVQSHPLDRALALTLSLSFSPSRWGWCRTKMSRMFNTILAVSSCYILLKIFQHPEPRRLVKRIQLSGLRLTHTKLWLTKITLWDDNMGRETKTEYKRTFFLQYRRTTDVHVESSAAFRRWKTLCWLSCRPRAACWLQQVVIQCYTQWLVDMHTCRKGRHSA